LLNCSGNCCSPYMVFIWALKGLRTGLIKGFLGISTVLPIPKFLLSSKLRLTPLWFVWRTIFYLLGSICAGKFRIGAILKGRLLGARNLFGVGALSNIDSKSIFGLWLYIFWKNLDVIIMLGIANLYVWDNKIPVQKTKRNHVSIIFHNSICNYYSNLHIILTFLYF